MIEAKYRYSGEDKFNYRYFKSEEEMMKFLENDSKEIAEYDFREKQKTNPIKNWFYNIFHARKNWKKVKASPYASLTLALKARKLIIGILIPYLAYMTYQMISNYRVTGMMGLIQKLFTIGIMSFVCWKIYKTIPAAKKQIEYYKKYPHLINYCPTNVKQDVDDILNKIKENKEKGGKNV